MPHEKLRPQFTFDEERIAELKRIAPEVFADGKINWETLHEALGDHLEDESADAEHFGLFWAGKRDARRMAAQPSKGTLVPLRGNGVDEDSTRNIFIEGENLEVLKLLQKSYKGRVKMIYIDPPYNTGNDFVYEDDFKEPLEEYLRRTGQLDEEGKPLTTNTKADGRFHSKWLSMMYPRLRLARNLLREDGVIFINIDHNENANLRLLMNEVYGEENFLADVIWKHTQQSKNDERFFSRQYNNLFVYSKSEDIENLRFPRKDQDNKNYSNPDNDPKGLWRSGDVRSPSYRKTLCFKINTPSGKKISSPENGWRWSEAEVLKKIERSEIVFNKDETRIIRKIYLSDQEGRTPENVWIGDNYGTTRSANAE
ncbi:MAG TPA: site-specific DNA-methyltransferase [Chitinophagales bacterium]|nr:site-specific DNA-methyltransferase [Chitinophagales bacterium]